MRSQSPAGHQVLDVHAVQQHGVDGDEPPMAPPPDGLAAHDHHTLLRSLRDQPIEGVQELR
ncbi:hypothetical protein ACFC25_20225 [Pseudarthrobacter sp. NPDC055928]|uniref:hypothetical protein n=1 Tax=Pseudarthrobacter sp. NPDC055928 TaxID=3345661 RepID=UPI0035DFA924